MNRRDELAITILRIIADGDLGTDQTGYFSRLEDIIEEIDNKQDTKSIINNFLLPKKYIRKINDKFKEVHNHELEYVAYQITQLGRTYLNSANVLSSSLQNSVDRPIPRAQSDGRMAIGRLDTLIRDADVVLSTHTPNPPGMIGFATLDEGKFQQWKASSENIIKTICGKDSGYLENFKKETKSGAYQSCVEAGRGILLAVKDDVDAGLNDHANSPDIGTLEVSNATINSDVVNLKINHNIYSHIKKYLETEDYFHAVEESYKVVRGRLRDITGKEKATDVFNMNAENQKYHKQIFDGKAMPDTPESDFYRGVGYLNLAIQFLRNEKSHTLATTLDKNLALHYISLASLAYDLITGSNES